MTRLQINFVTRIYRMKIEYELYYPHFCIDSIFTYQSQFKIIASKPINYYLSILSGELWLHFLYFASVLIW